MKKFLKVFANIILGLIVFVATLALLILGPVKYMLGKGNIKNVITSIDIEDTITKSPEYKEMVDELLDPIYEETRKFGISDEIVVKIIDSKEVKSLIADISSNVVDFALTGESKQLLSTEDIESLVSDAIDDINNLKLYEISEEQKDDILNIVQDKATEYEEFMPTTDMIADAIPTEDQETLELVQFTLSDTLMWYFAIALGVALLLLALINYAHGKIFKVGTIPVLVASSLTTLASAVIFWVAKMQVATDFPYVYDIVYQGIKFSLILSGSILIGTIVILIVYAIVSSKLNKKKVDA